MRHLESGNPVCNKIRITAGAILYGTSIAPVGEVEYRIDIDLDRFRREGRSYVREIGMELEEELYILVQYFGRDRIYAMALESI